MPFDPFFTANGRTRDSRYDEQWKEFLRLSGKEQYKKYMALEKRKSSGEFLPGSEFSLLMRARPLIGHKIKAWKNRIRRRNMICLGPSRHSPVMVYRGYNTVTR